jgi:hypothetical protein
MNAKLSLSSLHCLNNFSTATKTATNDLLSKQNKILSSRIADITDNPDIWIPVDDFIAESRLQTDAIFAKYEKGGYNE